MPWLFKKKSFGLTKQQVVTKIREEFYQANGTHYRVADLPNATQAAEELILTFQKAGADEEILQAARDKVQQMQDYIHALEKHY